MVRKIVSNRVETDGGLVEEEDLRLVEQTASEMETLLHAARVVLDLVMLPAFEPERLEQLCYPPARNIGPDLVQVCEVPQVVEA